MTKLFEFNIHYAIHNRPKNTSRIMITPTKREFEIKLSYVLPGIDEVRPEKVDGDNRSLPNAVMT